MKRITGVMLFLLLMIATAAGCTSNTTKREKSADGSITFKIGHASSETVPAAHGLARFEELVEEKSGGKINVEVYNNGQLGGESDYMVNCQLGVLDMAIVNQSILSSFFKDITAVDLPYIIESYEHADRVFGGETGEYYRREIFEKTGVQTLDIWEVGFRNLTNDKKAVNSIEDVKGLKIRTMDNKAHQAFWKELGVDPVPMSWNEAYTAMQQGAIDGQENPLSIILGNNVAEVNKELAITEHVYSSVFFLMSGSAWNALNEEEQNIMMECAKEAGFYEREVQRAQAEDALSQLEEKGMKVTTPEKDAFMEKSKSFQAEYGKEYADIMKMIEDAR